MSDKISNHQEVVSNKGIKLKGLFSSLMIFTLRLCTDRILIKLVNKWTCVQRIHPLNLVAFTPDESITSRSRFINFSDDVVGKWISSSEVCRVR